MKKIVFFVALLCVSTVLLNVSTYAQKHLSYGGSLEAKLTGIERVLPNGNIVVADIVYKDEHNREIGAVYLYDAARTTVISTLKGAKDGDRLASGGINVLPNGDFEVISPEYRDQFSGKRGATTVCSQTNGCAAEITAENSRFGISGDVKARTKANVAPEMFAPQAGAPVFDSMTNITGFSIPTATRTFMGQAYNLAAGTTDLRIASFRTVLASAAAVNYTQIQLNIQFWGTADTLATPVFSNALALYTYSFAASNLAANTIYTIEQDLPQLLTLPGTTNLGVTFNYKGNTGAGLVNTDNLTTAIRGNTTTPMAVGSTPINAYYRNASGRTDFNFNANDQRNIGPNSAIALVLFNPAAPTAAPISISGRVIDGKRGVANASVEITDVNGNIRAARANALGYFTFADVEAGATYVINVSAKRFSFAPQVVSASDNVKDLVFSPK